MSEDVGKFEVIDLVEHTDGMRGHEIVFKISRELHPAFRREMEEVLAERGPSTQIVDRGTVWEDQGPVLCIVIAPVNGALEGAKTRIEWAANEAEKRLLQRRENEQKAQAQAEMRREEEARAKATQLEELRRKMGFPPKE